MDALVLSLLLTAALLATRLPDSKAVVVIQTGGAPIGPSICPGPCRCGVLNNGPQQREAPEGAGAGAAEEGAGPAAEGALLSRQRRFLNEGERVRANLYPWLVAVTRLPPYSGFSAGALVSDRHVLTAASTVLGVPRNALRVTLSVGAMCGLPDGTAINMSVAEVQPLSSTFSSDGDGDDLALLLLASPVRFSATLRPVCLPPNERSVYTGRNAMVVGFGGNDTSPLVAADTSAAAAGAGTVDNGTATGFAERCRPRALLQPVVAPRECASVGQGSSTGCVGSPGLQQVVCPRDAGSLVQVRGARGEVQLIGVVSNTNNCTEGELAPAQFTLTAPNMRTLLRRMAGSCFCAAP